MTVAARPTRRTTTGAALAAAAVLASTGIGVATAGAAAPGNGYRVTPLVADAAGAAAFTDPSLVNGWGLSQGPNTPVWVSDNGTGVATLYLTGATDPKQNLTVTVPGDSPTGQAFNGDSAAFAIPGASGMAPARFLFATESGVISGWNLAQARTTDPATGAVTSAAVPVVTDPTAVFKGLAIGAVGGQSRLYATDFHNGKVDVYDAAFHPVTTDGAFTDRQLPAGYAPFGIANVGGEILVSYARQDAAAHDDVAGQGHGVIDAFAPDGRLLRRLVQHGQLDSPWGMAVAPAGFGRFAGDLLVGNFGNGRIHAFDLRTGNFRGTLKDSAGAPLVIDGLWGLLFGNGTSAPTSTLMFSAGPQDESHGLFGTITAGR